MAVCKEILSWAEAIIRRWNPGQLIDLLHID